MFLVVGHESTRYGTIFFEIFWDLTRFNIVSATWALYALMKAPEIQIKLREELLSVDMETPSMDELMALFYLDATMREILRVDSAVPGSVRIAMKDDMLPVEKPYTDKNGVVHESIRYTSDSLVVNPMYILSLSRSINKGDQIFIPILAINQSWELWGLDAHEFKYVSLRLVASLIPCVPPPT